MVGWLKVLLFVAGGTVAAAGTAYVTGLFDPWLARNEPIVAEEEAQPAAPQTPQQQTEAEPEAIEPAEDAPEETVAAEKQDRLVLPTIDILRVEPDGSILIAGKAGSKAMIDVMNGDTVVARATADASGDFVAMPDQPLPPGDYQLSLRAITGDVTAMSTQTAVVAIPEKEDGQVLALVETPGSASQLITVPQPEATAPDGAEPEAQVATAPNAQQPAEMTAPETATEPVAPADDSAQQEVSTPADVAEGEVAAAQVEPVPADEAAVPAASEPQVEEEIAAVSEAEQQPEIAQKPASTVQVVVEAVEIEGNTIFVAGHAAPGHSVRVYADNTVLGEARVSEGGRFLVEARRDLPVGSYVIRADLLDTSGAVVARAAVPFEREPGEAIAAVARAPETPASQTPTQAQPATAANEGAIGGEQAAATAAADVTAPALQRVDGSVIIRRGDNLWRISRRVYGQGIRYSTIYLANQNQIRNPDLIWPGQVFTVPQKTAEGEQADLDAIADQLVEPEAHPGAQSN